MKRTEFKTLDAAKAHILKLEAYIAKANKFDPNPIVDDETSVDDRHKVEDVPVLRAHEPVNARGRKRAAKRRGNRYGVHDVAQRAETNEQDPGQGSRKLVVLPNRQSPVRAIRVSSSRVAWVFESPTMAVRPPYASTAVRSGTVSTV